MRPTKSKKEHDAVRVTLSSHRTRCCVNGPSSNEKGVLDYGTILNGMNKLNVDDTGNTFSGVLNGRFKVYVDPYAGNFTAGSDNGMHYFVVGYKGSSAYDAGLFYCPYVPLKMVRGIGENTFQPKIGFKTRYAVVENPFSQGLTAIEFFGVVTANSNEYYRGVAVKGLLG